MSAAYAVAAAGLGVLVHLRWRGWRTAGPVVLRVALPMVVLTGWSGQISFGQMALSGIGAAVGATVTTRWHVDLTLSLLLGGVAAAVAALVVGLPALRLRGMYLAVTTFALALATET